MSINTLIIAIIGFTFIISGCIDKKSYTANESMNSDENNLIAIINNTTASEQSENNIKSKDDGLSINIILEKPPQEVIGGD